MEAMACRRVLAKTVLLAGNFFGKILKKNLTDTSAFPIRCLRRVNRRRRRGSTVPAQRSRAGGFLRLEGNKTVALANIRPPAKPPDLTAEALVKNGDWKLAAFVFGPENGPGQPGAPANLSFAPALH
jgi:hypothetical protein